MLGTGSCQEFIQIIFDKTRTNKYDSSGSEARNQGDKAMPNTKNQLSDSYFPVVEVLSVAELPTRFGHFRIVAFRNDLDDKEHTAIVRGDIANQSNVPTRLHSECLTGDAIGSLRCDCRDQLQTALSVLGRSERGLLLYLRQEGRGIGLANKVCAYALQDRGLDTVEANHALGFEDDLRDYTIAARMIQALEVRSVQLMTNNPQKIGQLTRHGVVVAGRIPHVMPSNPHNRHYLQTKAERSGHWIEVAAEVPGPTSPLSLPA
jgi:GTP cyclohydrolase II